MTTTSLMPVPKQRYTTALGTPIVGGKIYTYAAGTTNPKATYSDTAGATPQPNPIPLNLRGEPDNAIYWNGAYRIDVFDALNNLVYSVDNYVSSNYYTDSSIATFQAALAAGANTLVGWIQSGAGAVARYLRDKLREHPSAPDFGAVGDNLANDTAAALSAANAKTLVEFPAPASAYRMSQFPAVVGPKEFKGLGLPTVSLFNAGNSALAQLQSDSYYEGIIFRSTEADLNSQRVAIDDKQNVVASRCEAYDFRNPSSSNAWGVLVQRSNNIVLDRWKFGNNTQSDIAITDSCRDITVIHPMNTQNNGVFLNIEPNGKDGLVGGNFIGGHYREVDLLENENTAYASKNLVFTGCRIDKLMYDGVGATFVNCQIGQIVQEGQAHQVAFAGPLMIDSCYLDKNLLADPYLFDLSPTDATCYWTSYSSLSFAAKRYDDAEHGKYCRLNAAAVNQQVIATTRNFIPVTALESLMVYMRSRCDNRGTGTEIADHIIIQWYDATPTLLLETSIKTTRTAANTLSDWCNDVVVVQAPANATQCKFRITTNYTGTSLSTLDVAAVGLFRYNLLPTAGSQGNMPAVLAEYMRPVTNKTYYQDQIPAGVNGYPGVLPGERIVRKTPVVGQPKAWVCTAGQGVAGDPGTLVSEGVL